MSVHGKISQFIPSQESWSSYTERLEYYFIANDVQDPAKKKAILLTVCGPSAFQLLKNLLQPNTPDSKSLMTVDTGASLAIISEQTFRAIASPTDKLQSTSVTLTTYSGNNLHIMGTYDV